jgi:hypothetical protein
MKYVGLTDDPVRRKKEHGNPEDWEADLIRRDGYTGKPGGAGWKYGYTYTKTLSTVQ